MTFAFLNNQNTINNNLKSEKCVFVIKYKVENVDHKKS